MPKDRAPALIPNPAGNPPPPKSPAMGSVLSPLLLMLFLPRFPEEDEEVPFESDAPVIVL